MNGNLSSSLDALFALLSGQVGIVSDDAAYIGGQLFVKDKEDRSIAVGVSPTPGNIGISINNSESDQFAVIDLTPENAMLVAKEIEKRAVELLEAAKPAAEADPELADHLKVSAEQDAAVAAPVISTDDEGDDDEF